MIQFFNRVRYVSADCGRHMPFAFKHVAALVLVLLCVSVISGCNNCRGRCQEPPEEAIAEMQLFGMTLTVERNPFPRSIDLEYVPGSEGVEPYVGTNYLHLYFAPHPDYTDVEYPSAPLNGWSEYPYEFTYSQLIDGKYIEFPPLEFSQDFVYLPNTYNNAIRISDYPEELIFGGNHILRTPSWEMPLNATHVELWYQEDAEADRTLVRRTPLENLFAWRRYVQPLLEEQQE